MSNSVLVIEDEQEVREMLSFSLSRSGFNVWEAASAEEALRRLDGPLPSLVIIDWMLPGMNGVDLARRLRRGRAHRRFAHDHADRQGRRGEQGGQAQEL